MKKKKKKIISCRIYKIWTDYGYEYDCEYKTDIICEDCICNGGKFDPRTGKVIK